MKTCTKCRKEYPATSDYFYRDSHTQDGLKPSCKDCNKLQKNNKRKKEGKKQDKTKKIS